MTAIAKPAQFNKLTQQRRGMIGKINVARHQLQLHEDDYRQLLADTTGKTSLRECSDAQLERMIGALKAKGFKQLPRKGMAQSPMAKKARALWISLYQLGEVRNPSEQALEAFAKRQLGCDRMSFANQRQAFQLIEALKAMAARAGWKQMDPVTGKKMEPRKLQLHLCEVILARLKEAGEVPDDWTIDRAAWTLCGIETAATERGYSAEDYARLADALGQKLRQAKGAGQ